MIENKHLKTRLFLAIAGVGLMLLLLLLWKQQATLNQLKDDNRRLQEQNLGLLNNSLLPQPVATNPAIAPPAPPSEPVPPESTPAIDAHAPQPEKNRLVLSGVDVSQTTNGLVAIMKFKPSKSGPLGLVAMSVRLPPNLNSTIQSLKPLGPAQYTESESTVSEDGRFAFFQGTLGDEPDVQIALGVSSAALAFVKGSCGIGGFQLNIQPTNSPAQKP